MTQEWALSKPANQLSRLSFDVPVFPAMPSFEYGEFLPVPCVITASKPRLMALTASNSILFLMLKGAGQLIDWKNLRLRLLPLEAFETPTCKLLYNSSASIGANASAPNRNE